MHDFKKLAQRNSEQGTYIQFPVEIYGSVCEVYRKIVI